MRDELDRLRHEHGAATGEARRLEEFNQHLQSETSAAQEHARQAEHAAAVLQGQLDAAQSENATLKRSEEALRATTWRLRLENSRLRTRSEALSGLLEGFVQGTLQLLGSRRWRLGHALLSLRHRLLLRAVPKTAADQLQAHIRRYQETEEIPSLPAQAETPDAAAQTAPVPRREISVAVIAWDVGHNPLGRAYLVAEALARSYSVTLLGFQFPRYGTDIWKPLRHAPFRTIAIPAGPFPEFQQTLERLAPRIDADVIVAGKARLPSVQFGLMLKAFRNRPLIIDVDDYELSFFQNDDPLRDISALPEEALAHPFEEAWTRHTETLLPYADRVLASNPAIAAKFGGTIVPHARDETKFDPELHNRAEARHDLGIPEDEKVVMFVGTPRPHKGVLEILQAVRSHNRPDYRFVVVGTPPEQHFAKELAEKGGETLLLIPDTPFDRLPALLAAADLVCLLQDPDSEISQYQLPAKVVDALAMGIPILATAVPPLADLIEDELITPVTPATLAPTIAHWLEASPEDIARRAGRTRKRFLRDFSYAAIHRTLFREIESALIQPRDLPPAAQTFLNAQHHRYSPDPTTDPLRPHAGATTAPTPRHSPLAGESRKASSLFSEGGPPTQTQPLDIALFWKQGDLTLYGRRVDMVITHLARRDDVRRIAVFDAPFSVREMWRTDTDDFNHHNQITQTKLARRWGLFDDPKISHHVFLFDSAPLSSGRHKGARSLQAERYPRESDFPTFVAEELDRVGINPHEAIFWHYPVLEPIEELNRRLKPKLTVVDVVDDLRTWPDRTPTDREHLTEHYRTVLGQADVAFANCQTVRDSMARFFPDITLVPNGCDLDAPPPDPDDERFRHLCSLEGPILGLVGNLEAKTDLGLLETVASERPGYNLVLIGSTHTNTEVQALSRHPNVHLYGVVTYPTVKAWVKRFDIGLIPHKNTEQTQSMHPLKLLVYAAAGIPVVSTDIQNLGSFRPHIQVAETPESFLQAIDQTLSDSPNLTPLKAEAQSQSWPNQITTMLNTLPP